MSGCDLCDMPTTRPGLRVLAFDDMSPTARDQWARAHRSLICARCSYRRVFLGVDWCGLPYPVRPVRLAWRKLRRYKPPLYMPSINGADYSCGCLMPIKRRLRYTPVSVILWLATLGRRRRIAVECPGKLWGPLPSAER